MAQPEPRYTPADEIALASVDVVLALGEVYAKVW